MTLDAMIVDITDDIPNYDNSSTVADWEAYKKGYISEGDFAVLQAHKNGQFNNVAVKVQGNRMKMGYVDANGVQRAVGDQTIRDVSQVDAMLMGTYPVYETTGLLGGVGYEAVMGQEAMNDEEQAKFGTDIATTTMTTSPSSISKKDLYNEIVSRINTEHLLFDVAKFENDYKIDPNDVEGSYMTRIKTLGLVPSSKRYYEPQEAFRLGMPEYRQSLNLDNPTNRASLNSIRKGDNQFRTTSDYFDRSDNTTKY